MTTDMWETAEHKGKLVCISEITTDDMTWDYTDATDMQSSEWWDLGIW